jgi:hypothetical protein
MVVPTIKGNNTGRYNCACEEHSGRSEEPHDADGKEEEYPCETEYDICTNALVAAVPATKKRSFSRSEAKIVPGQVNNVSPVHPSERVPSGEQCDTSLKAAYFLSDPIV